MGNDTDFAAVVGADGVEVAAGVSRGPAAPALPLRTTDRVTLRGGAPWTSRWSGPRKGCKA